MRDPSKHGRVPDDADVQRLVVIELLDRKDGLTPAMLERKLRGRDREIIEAAVASLEEAGVVIVKRSRIHVCAVVRHIDELGLIGI
jgi:hypothetical protein